MNDGDRLLRLLATHHACIFLPTNEEEEAAQLLNNVAIERGCDLMVWSATRGLRDGLVAASTVVPDTAHPAAALVHVTENIVRHAVYVFVDLVGHLKDERTLRAAREAVSQCAKQSASVILIDHHSRLAEPLNTLATRFDLSLPSDEELEKLIKACLRTCNEKKPIAVNITRKGLDLVIRNLHGLSRRQARQIIVDTVMDDCRFDELDINHILARKRKALGSDGLLEYIESPTDLTSVGGLSKLKQWLLHRREALSASAAEFGIPAPRGVMMLGVQGAGKSLAAKAVATAWQRPLLRLDPGVLFDRYVGESEQRLRDALRQAESMAPVVLWIDEIEKGFASAASQSTDGGLSKRMFGTMLTWMQEHTAPVFLIATANDIEALPPELLRKGRFDEIFFVDLPACEARKAILQIHLKRLKRDVEVFDISALAEASDGFSGAEIEQAIISGLHTAFTATQELSTRHIHEAIKLSPPLSVTMAEKIDALRSWAEGRCVPAD